MAMQFSFQNMLGIFSLRLESLLRVEFFNLSVNHLTRMTQRPRSDISRVRAKRTSRETESRHVFALSLALLRAFLCGTKLPRVNKKP